MRVIDCEHCGEAISAAGDDVLAGRPRAHLADEHDESLDPEELEELVETEAYDADA